MSAVDDHKYRIDLTTRQVEVNEWTYNNKMDTLFVFQLVFLIILIVSLLVALKGYGLIGTAFTWYAVVIILGITTILVVNRAYYSQMVRDRRYWNQRRFAEDGLKESPLAKGSTTMQDHIDAVRGHFGESGRDTAPPCTCP